MRSSEMIARRTADALALLGHTGGRIDCLCLANNSAPRKLVFDRLCGCKRLPVVRIKSALGLSVTVCSLCCSWEGNASRPLGHGSWPSQGRHCSHWAVPCSSLPAVLPIRFTCSHTHSKPATLDARPTARPSSACFWWPLQLTLPMSRRPRRASLLLRGVDHGRECSLC